ncbi:hypothetical protein GEMRC1_005956 [Eukaryota sp. GEM-RC1]
MACHSAFSAQLTTYLQQTCEKLQNIQESEVYNRLRSTSKINEFRVPELRSIIKYFNDVYDANLNLSCNLKRKLADSILEFIHRPEIHHLINNASIPQVFDECSQSFIQSQHPFYYPISNFYCRSLPSTFPSRERIHLRLPPQVSAALTAHSLSNNFAVVIRIWLPEETPPVTHWTSHHGLTVNGNRVDVSQCVKKIRGTVTPQKIITQIPAEITSYLDNTIPSNTIDFESPSNMSGMLVFQLVDKLSLIKAVNKVADRPPIKFAPFDFDDELAAVTLELSLMDPLSFMRINRPARGIKCSHRECFDLNTFISHSAKTCIWQCPICSQSLSFLT